MAAFSVADMIASPLTGRWSDRTGNTRFIVLVANVPQFLGSVMYFMGLSPWFLVASRFVVGLGAGAGAALMADIARVTSQEERTSIYSKFMLCRHLGLLVGPACNLFLMRINFNIGPFSVNPYSVPGLFIAVLWIFHELLTIFMFWNPVSLHVQEQIEQSGALPHSSSEYQIPEGERVSMRSDSVAFPRDDSSKDDIRDMTGHVLDVDTPGRPGVLSPPNLDSSDPSSVFASSNNYMEVAEQYMGGMTTRRENGVSDAETGAESTRPLLAPESPSVQSRGYGATSLASTDHDPSDVSQSIDGGILTDADNNSTVTRRNTDRVSLSYYMNEFLRDTIIAILATIFVEFFNQLSLETMVTPLTNRLAGWGEFENSILYFGCAVEIILVFLVIMPLSRRFLDRTLIMCGFSLETISLALFLWFIPQAVPMDNRHNLPILIIGIFINLVGMPLLIVSSASLYSKMVKEEMQGVAQGVRRVFAQVGTILGALWAGSMLDRPYWMFGVMVGVNVFGAFLLLLSFNRLVDTASSRPRRISPTSSETQPLIS